MVELKQQDLNLPLNRYEKTQHQTQSPCVTLSTASCYQPSLLNHLRLEMKPWRRLEWHAEVEVLDYSGAANKP